MERSSFTFEGVDTVEAHDCTNFWLVNPLFFHFSENCTAHDGEFLDFHGRRDGWNFVRGETTSSSWLHSSRWKEELGANRISPSSSSSGSSTTLLDILSLFQLWAQNKLIYRQLWALQASSNGCMHFHIERGGAHTIVKVSIAHHHHYQTTF